MGDIDLPQVLDLSGPIKGLSLTAAATSKVLAWAPPLAVPMLPCFPRDWVKYTSLCRSSGRLWKNLDSTVAVPIMFDAILSLSAA